MEEKKQPNPAKLLLLAAALTILLWQIPYGQYVLYPFTILATWFHEMGHGMSALFFGGQFSYLEIFKNGSGLAHYNGQFEHWEKALIAAGGLLGPPMAGNLLILAGSTPRLSHITLFLLSTVIIISVLLWIRTAFGMGMMLALAVVILFLATKASAHMQCFVIQFLGVQACVSSSNQLSYLFTNHVAVGSHKGLSDTGKIAEELSFMPYWFWGIVIAIISFLLLLIALKWANRKQKVSY